MNCVLDGDTSDPQRLIQAIKRVMVNGGAFPRCWVCSRAPVKAPKQPICEYLRALLSENLCDNILIID